MKRIMSWTVCLTLVLTLLTGTAFAMPVQLTNGAMTVPAVGYMDNSQAEIELQSFQLVGRGDDGSYLVYVDQGLYRVQAADLQRAIVVPDGVPVLGMMGLVKRGTISDQVATMQQALKNLGYLSGSVDGDFGQGTQNAVTSFQQAMGLEANGIADEITQLLALSMAGETVYLEAMLDPTVMFAPIIDRVTVDLQPVLDSGMVLNYDDIAGEGFISDGSTVRYDASGTSELDKYEVTVRFGLLTRETDGVVELLPAMKIRCLCVRRPVMNEVTLKSGTARDTAPIEDLKVSLDGIYTVEEGVALMTDAMVDALADAAEAGDLKLRIEGQYNSFDVSVGDLTSPSLVGSLARQLRQ